MGMDDLGTPSLTAREAMVASQLRPAGVNAPALLAAILDVPRERFVPAGRVGVAYVDRPIELGGGRELNSPEVTALMLNALLPQAGERALVVGAATGWSAAVLARMGCVVTALESDERLASGLAEALAGLDVAVASGPLAGGHEGRAPYDLILVDGAIAAVPDMLSGQLASDGRLAAAIGDEGVTRLVLGRRAGEAFGVQAFADASAAPLPGFDAPRVFTF